MSSLADALRRAADKSALYTTHTPDASAAPLAGALSGESFKHRLKAVE